MPLLGSFLSWWRGSAPPQPPTPQPPARTVRRDATGAQVVKLMIIGDAGVGKTSLMERWVDGRFPQPYYSTLVSDFKIKHITHDDERLKVQIWDTAGQERFRAISHAYYRGMQGILLAYDVCCRASFESIGHWMAEARRHAPEVDANHALVLAGNKSDREQPNAREVGEEEGEAFAAEHGMLFFETSAKDDANVHEAFMALLARATGQEGMEPPQPLLHGAMPCAEACLAEEEEEGPGLAPAAGGPRFAAPAAVATCASAGSCSSGVGVASSHFHDGSGSSSSSSSSSSDDDE